MIGKYSLKNIDLVNFLFLTLTPIGAIIGTYFWVATDGFHYGQVILGIVFYFLTGMSITAGYHRLFAHKTYDAHPLIKLFYLLFGAAAFENSVLKWGSDHRLHHFKVDTEEDPYSIKEGFFHAHIGWVFLKKNNEVKERFAKDFRHDRLVMWQHKYYLPISVTVGMILPTILGGLLCGSYLGGFVVGSLARIVFTQHCTFFINSLCHCLGNTPYTDTNSAKDSWFMALLTFGEGYHNFHHYFQTDYRNGIRWFHFDPTKWLIKSLNFVGLTHKLKITPQDKILAAKMQMKAKELKSKAGDSADKFMLELEKLKAQALDTYRRYQELKAEYKNSKSKLTPMTLNEMKAKIAATRDEFEACIQQWEFMVKHYSFVQALI